MFLGITLINPLPYKRLTVTSLASFSLRDLPGLSAMMTLLSVDIGMTVERTAQREASWTLPDIFSVAPFFLAGFCPPDALVVAILTQTFTL